MSSTQALKTQMGSQKTINEMPNELLDMIFNCIDFKTQLNAQLVCKRWHQLIETSIQKTTSILIKDFYNLDNSIGYELYEISFKDLFIIRISDFNTISIKERIKTIVQRCVTKFANLKALYVHLIDGQNELNPLEWVSDSCHSKCLIKLCIQCSSMCSITQRTADKLSMFKELEVFQCEYTPEIDVLFNTISKNVIQQLFKNWPKLKAILLNGFSYGENERHLGEEFQYLSDGIECLRMEERILNDNSLQLLANRANNRLKSLTIIPIDASMHWISMNSIGNLKSLSTLHIEIVGDVAYELVFDNISKLVHLKVLYLSLFPFEIPRPSIGFNHLKRLKDCPKLQTLYFKDCFMNSDSMKAIPRYLKSISKIDLYIVRGISGSDAINEFIAPVVEIEGLKDLRIDFLPALTDVMVMTLIKNCRQLCKLHIHFRDDISTDAINNCIQLAHNRKIRFSYWQKNNGIYRSG